MIVDEATEAAKIYFDADLRKLTAGQRLDRLATLRELLAEGDEQARSIDVTITRLQTAVTQWRGQMRQRLLAEVTRTVNTLKKRANDAQEE